MPIPLTEPLLELPRTAAELRSFIDEVRAAVQSDSDEFARGIRHEGLYKEFIDEVVPLCAFASLAYSSDFKIQWKSGNQGHDAIVFDATGVEVDRIELARPHDGRHRSEVGDQLAAGHAALLEASDYDKPLEHLKEFIESSAASKSHKDYSGITLVFAPVMLPPIAPLEVFFERQLDEICVLLKNYRFKAKRVVLLAPGRLLQVQ